MRRSVWLLALGACDIAPPPAPIEVPSEPVPLGADAISGAQASSYLDDKGTTFLPQHAVDGDRSTAWCEGADGLGEGESLTVTLKRDINLAEIRIDGGFFKDDRTLTNNGRPRKIKVSSDSGWSHILSLPKVPPREHRAKEIKTKPGILSNPGSATKVTFTLIQADEGRFTKDVCISEITFIPM